MLAPHLGCCCHPIQSCLTHQETHDMCPFPLSGGKTDSAEVTTPCCLLAANTQDGEKITRVRQLRWCRQRTRPTWCPTYLPFGHSDAPIRDLEGGALSCNTSQCHAAHRGLCVRHTRTRPPPHSAWQRAAGAGLGHGGRGLLCSFLYFSASPPPTI